MKKFSIVFILFCLLSCGSSKTVRTSKKILKGQWVMTSINTSAIGDFTLTLLDDSSAACFENSSWQFIPNNNTGNYVLSGLNCNNEARYFAFTIDEINEANKIYDFLLKPTDKKGKSELNYGYRLKINALTEDTMQWQQEAKVSGKTITITMNFEKL